jgi:hypothetical protein
MTLATKSGSVFTRKDFDDFWDVMFPERKGRDKMYRIWITKQVETDQWAPRKHTTLAEAADENGNIIKEYGYPRQVREKGYTEVTVLEQTVDELDLGAVIAAVNGLELKDV